MDFFKKDDKKDVNQKQPSSINKPETNKTDANKPFGDQNKGDVNKQVSVTAKQPGNNSEAGREQNPNKSVDSQNPQERRFQPTTENTQVRGDAGMDEKRKADRAKELKDQAPQTRLQTGPNERARQPEGARTADSVNPLEANSLGAHIQPTATKEERDRAEREFNKQEQVKGGKLDLRTATTAEKDALSSRTGLEPAQAAESPAQPNKIGEDEGQKSNKGSRKA